MAGLNKIEKMFLDAYNKIDNELDAFTLEIQKPIGIYKPDFIYGDCAVEIDGHEYHKTKEQREYDYKRDRYLTKQGYFVIRFMATEVYLDAEKCVNEMIEIAVYIDKTLRNEFLDGYNLAEERCLKWREQETSNQDSSPTTP